MAASSSAISFAYRGTERPGAAALITTIPAAMIKAAQPGHPAVVGAGVDALGGRLGSGVRRGQLRSSGELNPLRLAVSPTIGLRARHLSRTKQDRRVCRPRSLVKVGCRLCAAAISDHLELAAPASRTGSTITVCHLTPGRPSGQDRASTLHAHLDELARPSADQPRRHRQRHRGDQGSGASRPRRRTPTPIEITHYAETVGRS